MWKFSKSKETHGSLQNIEREFTPEEAWGIIGEFGVCMENNLGFLHRESTLAYSRETISKAIKDYVSHKYTTGGLLKSEGDLLANAVQFLATFVPDDEYKIYSDLLSRKGLNDQERKTTTEFISRLRADMKKLMIETKLAK